MEFLCKPKLYILKSYHSSYYVNECYKKHKGFWTSILFDRILLLSRTSVKNSWRYVAPANSNHFVKSKQNKWFLDLMSKQSFHPKKLLLKSKTRYYRSLNFEMSFWCLQFPPKNEQKQVDLRCHWTHSIKVEFIRSFFEDYLTLKICHCLNEFKV